SASSREVSDATDERPQLGCRRQGSRLAQTVRRDGPRRVTIPISGMLTSTLSLFGAPPARIINKQTRSRSVEAGQGDPPTSERRTYHGNLDARSELLSLTPHGHEGTSRDAGIRGGLRPGAQVAGYHRCGGRRSQFEVLRADHRHDGDAQYRRRAASFRMERLLVLPMPQRTASARRAPLSGRARLKVLAH